MLTARLSVLRFVGHGRQPLGESRRDCRAPKCRLRRSIPIEMHVVDATRVDRAHRIGCGQPKVALLGS